MSFFSFPLDRIGFNDMMYCIMSNRKTKCDVLPMSECAAAWLGALLDGEGSVYKAKGHAGRRRRLPWIAIANTEVELIATCLRITGAGTIQTRLQPSAAFGSRRMWCWMCQKVADVPVLLQRLAPYSLKAQKAIISSSTGKHGGPLNRAEGL